MAFDINLINCATLDIADLLRYPTEVIVEILQKCSKESSGGSSTPISPYDVAVSNGYTGTVQEWLLSLVGKDGTNGKDGINGIDGKDGTNGLNGLNGKDAVIDYNTLLSTIITDDDLIKRLSEEVQRKIIAVDGEIDTSSENVIGLGTANLGIVFDTTSGEKVINVADTTKHIKIIATPSSMDLG